jgi:hypothetical protein
VALVRTGVSEDRSVSIIRVAKIVELGTILAVTSNRRPLRRYILCVLRLLVTANAVTISPILVTLTMKALRSLKLSVLTRAARLNIPEDDILHSHCRENIKSYIALTGWAL